MEYEYKVDDYIAAIQKDNCGNLVDILPNYTDEEKELNEIRKKEEDSIIWFVPLRESVEFLKKLPTKKGFVLYNESKNVLDFLESQGINLTTGGLVD